jgi:hypothetical protein
LRAYSNWRWHLDEVVVKINIETYYVWRAVDWKCCSLVNRALVEQPGGKRPSTVPATRTGNAQVQEYKDASEIRLRSFFNPQPLQSRTPPYQSSNFQTQPYRRT